MKGLKGRVACVTGAAQGIGQRICVRLASEGAKIAVMDILNTEETVNLCLDTGSDAKGYYLDVTDKNLIHKVVQQINDQWGRIDIWVNNAGVFDNTATVDVSEELWDRVSDINYKAMFLCSQAVIPIMEKNQWGRFINLSSMAGKMAYSEEIAYCSTKAAVLGLTRALAVELGGRGITANAICPGPIETEMLKNTYQHLADINGVTLEEWCNSILKTIPVNRFGKPEDVAALVAFLASEEAGFINGQSINIDGGLVFY
jgi:NAD(P)-dependent dehydrogenase (short-subunit alcohol dehydrogenase family)